MRYVVGRSPDEAGEVAVEVAALLAAGTESTLEICLVLPQTWDFITLEAEYVSYLKEKAQETLADTKELLGDRVPAHYHVRMASSAAAALLELAEEMSADAIVVGSSRRGLRRLALGSTTNALLHRSPLPVVLGPERYRPPPDTRVSRASVAVAGGPAEAAELDAAVALVSAHGAAIRLVSFYVAERQMFPPPVGFDSELGVQTRWRNEIETLHEQTRAMLPGDVEVSSAVGEGETWDEALEALPWLDGEVLLVGSSRHGRARQIFLGSNSVRIVRAAPVPVEVVPA